MLERAARIGLVGLSLTACTAEVRAIPGECTAAIIEVGDMMDVKYPTYDGIAIPANKNGDTVIFVRDKKGKLEYMQDSVSGDLLNHEIGHAVQFCKNKEDASVRYASNPGKYEKEADQYAVKKR